MFAGFEKSRNFALEFETILLREAFHKRIERFMGKYQSGQMGQTVNLLAYAFGGSNPSLPTSSLAENRGSSSVDRALAFQAGGRGFEPRLPLKLTNIK